MRIIAGRLKGRALQTPAGSDTRPTSDRLRGAIFNILAHGITEFAIDDARVLDLFAGTGALGLEAISRGARSALFIEEAPEARAIIRENIEALGLTGVTKIFRRDATDLGAAGKLGAFDLVFADPPYGQGLAEKAIAAALAGEWLASGAVIVVEEREGMALGFPEALTVLDQRSYGDSQVVFLRAPVV